LTLEHVRKQDGATTVGFLFLMAVCGQEEPLISVLSFKFEQYWMCSALFSALSFKASRIIRQLQLPEGRSREYRDSKSGFSGCRSHHQP
jgi:hypothetical protein